MKTKGTKIEFCCNRMRYNFKEKFVSIQSWSAEDRLTIVSLKGQIRGIDFCPFCGTRIDINK